MSDDDHPLKRPLTHVGVGVVVGAVAGSVLLFAEVGVVPALGDWGPAAVMAVVAVPASGLLLHVDPHPDRYERPLRFGIAVCAGGIAVSLVTVYSFLFAGPLPAAVLDRPVGAVAVGCLLGAGTYLAWLAIRR